MTAVILGCGYTGVRVARLLAALGMDVIATTREPSRLDVPGIRAVRLEVSEPFDLDFVPRGATVLHSIPSLSTGDATPALMRALGDKPSRVVYLSTTGVYGAQRDVDEKTPVAPREPREQVRVEAEQNVIAGPWSSLILRPAAIYGPGRGVHVSMAAGRWQLTGDGSNYVSRIHVDDLAAITAAALLRPDVTGAYPVADEEPCTSYEMAAFCAGLLGIAIPQPVPVESVHPTRRADRRVDGRAVCRELGITLQYPSYRVGIPASI